MRVLALGWLPLLLACSGATTSEHTAPEPEPKTPVALTPTPRGQGPDDVPQGAFTGAGDGCSNVLAYRGSEDRTQFAVVQLDKDLLGLEIGAAKTIDLGMTPEGVSVFVDVFASAISGESPYCTDHSVGEPELTRWMAQAGMLTIELAEDSASERAHPTYRATLHLERVHFVSPAGGFAVVVPDVLITSVRVGWLPG